MAVFFVTGLPRTGKTLWTLCHVRPKAEKEKRQVYTCNIPGMNVPGWLEIDHPDKWMEIPDGSIVIVDELQDFWGKAPPGSKVPLPILELSKHGKRGIDFYFITQEPDLVHHTPRSLCQHHYFVVRAFGSQNVMIYKFERMQLHPEKVKTKGEKLPWRYKKEAFNWYKSADTHNVKRQIPMKVWMIPGAAVVAGLMIWLGISLFMGNIDSISSGKLAGAPGAAIAQPGAPAHALGGLPGGDMPERKPMTQAEYIQGHNPRIEGLAYTAARYDSLMQPKQAPKPAACIDGTKPGTGKRTCQCWTQQATLLAVPDSMCKQIAAGGYFDDTLPAKQDATAPTPAPLPPVAVAQASQHTPFTEKQ